jgi:tRNA (adenine57-N1/adenine58-N1)-methyltransferase
MLAAGDLTLLWSPRKGDSFLVRLSPGSAQGSHLGQMKHDDIIGMDYGDAIRTNSGEPFFILRPSVGEYTRRIKRRTQVIFPKDSGFIIQSLNFGPGSTVVECGTGSGGMTAVFAHFAGDNGRVISYDRREEFSKLAESNAERWGVRHRIEFKIRDIAEGFDERDADAVFLDVRNPWDYMDAAKNALAWGRRVGIIVPTFNQIEQTLDALNARGFADVQVAELMLRCLKTDPRRIRPDDMMVGHTGFLIFAAKARPIPDTEPERCEGAREESGTSGETGASDE